MAKRLINKIAKKKADKCCHFCKYSEYAVLDCHRIVPGEQGGEYTEFNTVTSCANCHRKCHEGKIIIDRKYFSTAGWVLHYWEDGEEKWQ